MDTKHYLVTEAVSIPDILFWGLLNTTTVMVVDDRSLLSLDFSYNEKER